jgi:hypothetical protein
MNEHNPWLPAKPARPYQFPTIKRPTPLSKTDQLIRRFPCSLMASPMPLSENGSILTVLKISVGSTSLPLWKAGFAGSKKRCRATKKSCRQCWSVTLFGAKGHIVRLQNWRKPEPNSPNFLSAKIDGCGHDEPGGASPREVRGHEGLFHHSQGHARRVQ